MLAGFGGTNTAPGSRPPTANGGLATTRMTSPRVNATRHSNALGDVTRSRPWTDHRRAAWSSIALNTPIDFHRHLPVTQLFWDSTIATIHHPQHTVHLTASSWTAGRWRSDWQVHDDHLLARFALATLQITLRLPPRSRPPAHLSRKHPRFCPVHLQITPRDAFTHTSCLCRHPSL